MRQTIKQRLLLVLAGISLLTVIALLFLQIGIYEPIYHYDEGIIAYGAVRVLQGELPYRDFWTQYSPGQFYLVAGFFKFFGANIMVERWCDIIIRVLLALMFMAMSARLTNWKLALPTWVFAVLWLNFYVFFGYPIFPALTFALASIYTLLRGLTCRRFLCAAGILMGLCFIFRHDMAVYLCLSQMCGALIVILHKRGAPNSFIKHIISISKGMLPYFTGAALIILPVSIYFLVNVPLGELANQLLIFPLVEFPKVRGLPYPHLKCSLDMIPFYAPWLIYAAALSIAIMIMIRKQKDDDDLLRASGIVMVAIFGLCGFNQIRIRADIIHTVQFFLVSLILLPVLFQEWRWKRTASARGIAVAAIIIGIIISYNPMKKFRKSMRLNDTARLTLMNEGPTTTLSRSHALLLHPEESRVALEMQRLTRPDEYIYIGLDQHDKIFINDVLLYFLMVRNCPTRYHELHPGLVNTLPVQREMISDLEKHKPPYVVTTKKFSGIIEPNDSAKSTNVKLLDNYLSQKYYYINTIGEYKIYKRSGS